MAYPPGTLQIDYARPYETGTIKVEAMGQRAECPDGSIWRYSLMGATTGVANKLYQSAAAVAHWTNQDLAVAWTAGDTEVSFHDGGTAFTVNQLEGGHLITEETTLLGGRYRVKSNKVTAAQETLCTLEDGVSIVTTVAIADGCSAILNQWNAVIIYPATIPSQALAGIPCKIHAASAYHWEQTRGVASCLFDSGATPPVVGNAVRPSTDDVGAIELRDETAGAIDFQDIGYALSAGADAEFGLIFIQIE
jgi:hypothetical protein